MKPRKLPANWMGSAKTAPNAALKAGKDAARAMTREEWDAKHDTGIKAGALECGGMRNQSGGQWPELRFCTVCGLRPTDPRPASEIAALKAGKAVETAPVLTLEEWDRTHKVWGVSDCGYSVDLEPGNIPCCVHCGPRPPAQPVATEPAVAAPEPEHVPIEKSKPHVLSRISGWCYDARTISAEGDGSECPRCDTLLPSQLASLIRSGSHDCPHCGWHAGRCDHCNTKLVNSYVRGERDHGRVHCPRCQGVDE